MRRLDDLLPKAEREDLITVFMALQRQNYVLSNTVSNLVQQWPIIHPTITPEVQLNAGMQSETGN